MDAAITGIADAAITGIMEIAADAATTMIMTTVAVTTTAADAAAALITGIGTMTETETEIRLLLGLEAIIPTGTPVDAKNSKSGAGTYVSALFVHNIFTSILLIDIETLAKSDYNINGWQCGLPAVGRMKGEAYG